MDDVLALQVVQRQRHLTEVEFDGVLTELDALLQVVAEVSSQEEVHHHEHVLLVLERVPGGHSAQSLSRCVEEEGDMLHEQTHRLSTNSSGVEVRLLLHAAQHKHRKHLHTHAVYRNMVESV